MNQRLAGKIAVVTGASSGIGRAIVEQFVAEGAQVVAFARNREALQSLADAHAGKVLPVVGDVTQAADLQRLVDETRTAHGRVDVLVPNAGIARVVGFEDSTREAFETQFSVNLFGAVETVRRFLPLSVFPGWRSTAPARPHSSRSRRRWPPSWRRAASA